MTAHATHHCKFNDENGQHYALIVDGTWGESLHLLVWLGSENGGWQEKTSVPHGSAEQGYTYS